LNRNKRYIKEKSGEKIKRIIILIVLLVFMVIPMLILTISSNIKAKFFAYTMFDTFLVVVLFLFGILFAFVTNKNKVKIRSIIFTLICLVGSFYLIKPTINYYKDIPKIINSNYSSYKGNLTNVETHNSSRSISTILTINNQKFEIHGTLTPEFKTIGKEYYVTYLPNSRYVIKLQTKIVNPLNSLQRQNISKYLIIKPGK